MKTILFKYFILSLIFLIFSCESQNNSKINQIGEGYFLVSKVVDGDTFWVDNGTEKGLKIRLIGVDAPESRKTGKKEIGYYGQEAKAYLTEMLTGQSVKLVSDVDSLDRYGRTLSYVYLADETFVNAELVKNGYAMIMTIPPNVKYADLFLKLQKQAREKSIGLWKVQ